MAACLVLTAAPVASQDDLTTLLAAQGLSNAAPLALSTSSGTLAAGALPPAAYDAVVSVAQAPGHHTVALLGLLGAALKPGGKLVVQEVGAGGDAVGVVCLAGIRRCSHASIELMYADGACLPPAEHDSLLPRSTPLFQPGSTAEALQKTLLLSGFPGATAAPGGGVSATKPSWATGAKAAIALKPRSQQQQQQAAAAATWTLGGDGESCGGLHPLHSQA